MDRLGRLGAGGLGQAEDLAGRLVVPVAEEVDAVLALDGEVGGVGLGDRFGGQAGNLVVSIEKEWHRTGPPELGWFGVRIGPAHRVFNRSDDRAGVTLATAPRATLAHHRHEL